MSLRKKLKKLRDFNKLTDPVSALLPDKLSPLSRNEKRLGEKEAEEAALRRTQAEVERLNRGLVAPVGLDPGVFRVKADGAEIDQGSLIRRNTLKAFSPKLNAARKRGNIFAYNDAITSIREMVSRTAGGPKVPKSAPDSLMERKKAIRRQQRQPLGSRAQTLGLFY